MKVILTDEYRKNTSARAVPGAVFDSEIKAWTLNNPTPRAAAVALKLFPELAYDYPELEAKRDELRMGTRPIDHATAAGLLTQSEVGPSAEMDYYEFQSLDIGYVEAVLEQHGAAYIGWERGLGKTLAACTLIDSLGCQRSLIVAPNTAKMDPWVKHLKILLPGHQIVVLPNDKVKRERTLERVQGGRSVKEPFVLVVHYEALSIIESNPFGRKLKAGGGWKKLGMWDIVIADEAHRIKNVQAKQTRALKKIPTEMKLAMSGSIVENHAQELFSPLQWLFPDSYSSMWRDWNNVFLDYVEGPFGKVCVGVKAEKLADLQAELGVFMVYRRKEDELDLPERTDQTIEVVLTEGQRKAYDELRDTCVATLDSGALVATEDGLAMLTKLRQVATGLDLVSDVRDSSKLDTAVELITDNEDEAFLIFSWYKEACYSISDRLKGKNIDSFVVTGDIKDHEVRADYIRRFQDGEKRVFIGTISTMGESVDLYRASQVIFLDRSWNPTKNDQASDRIYRIGQQKPVTVTTLVAVDTVDEYNVTPAINSKIALRRAILGG